MRKVSAVLITHNEEHNLRDALESVRWADEIIVVDSFSTDRSVEIAREYTDKVYQRPWPGYVDQKNFAVSKAQHEWIFSIDADERVSDLLKREIEEWRKSETTFSGYFIPRKSFFLGRWIKHTSWYPDEKLRLFHRDRGRWAGGRVHESVYIADRTGRFEGELLHYSYRRVADYLQRLELYSTLAAQDYYERGKNIGFFTLTLNPFFTFIKNYIIKQGFRDGFPGLVISILASISAFFKYAKLWELHHSFQPSTVPEDRRLHILFIDTEKVWRGGQDQLLSLLTGLKRNGEHVSLVCQPESPMEKRARDEGITVYPIKLWNEFDIFTFFRFYRLFRSTRIDIVHYNTPRPIFLGTLASKIMRIPVRIISRRVNYPLRNNPYSRFKYQWGIDRIVAVSNSIRETLVGHGIDPRIIDTVHEGIDLASFDALPISEERFNRDGGRVIGTLAYMSDEKGLQYLVQAAHEVCRRFPATRFVLVGEGPLRKKLEGQVQELGLQSNVVFTGFRQDVVSLLKTFDAFALPSLSEGFPTVILYAMAGALPVVASHVGGIPEMVQDRITGLLVPPAQSTPLAEAFCQLLENLPLAQEMGRAGRRRIETVFNLDKKIAETLSIYRHTFNSNAHPLRAAELELRY